MNRRERRQTYDDIASGYGVAGYLPFYRHDDPLYRFTSSKVVENILSLLPSPLDELEILDAGCGGGFFLAHLAEAGAKAVGIDHSHKMAEIAQTRLGTSPRCAVAVCDIEELCFATGSFDYVLLLGVIEHVLGRDRALAELTRVIRRHGEIIIQVPNPSALYWKLYGVISSTIKCLFSFFRVPIPRQGRPQLPPQPEEPITLLEIRNALADNGMTVVDLCGFNFPLLLNLVKTMTPAWCLSKLISLLAQMEKRMKRAPVVRDMLGVDYVIVAGRQ